MSTVLPTLAVQAEARLREAADDGPPVPPSQQNEPIPADKPSPPASIKQEATLQVSAPTEAPNFLVPGPRCDFWVLPIPRRLQWNPDQRPEFGLLLNATFELASTFCVASLYYTQPILIVLAEDLNVSYEEVTSIPTLIQASYALGLLFITPLGDLVRRRQLVLTCVACSALLSLILAVVPTLRAFQAISFFLGAASVTTQILLPLAADLAKPERRATALAVVLSGLLLGLLFARVVSGQIAEHANVAAVFYMSFGLLTFTFGLLYFTIPDYPAKNASMTYIGILRSMVFYACTEPVLIQACFIGLLVSTGFTCFWTTLTFLLGGVYGYESGTIGLFALVGVLGVFTAPVVGKLVDRMVPWVGVALGLFVIAVSQAIWTGAAGISIGAVVVTIFLLDVGQQLQQVSNSTRIFAINPAARARFSAVYIFSLFVGQLVGTAAGTRVYLAAGYRASGGFCLGLIALATLILLTRSPHRPTNKWFGYSGGWEVRKGVAEKKRIERERLEALEREEKERAGEKSEAATAVGEEVGAGGADGVELRAVGSKEGV